MSVCHFILLYVALTNLKIFNIELHILYYIYIFFLLVTTTEPYPGSVRHTVDFFICRFNIYFARQTKLTFSCGRFGVFDRLLLFPSLNLSSSLLFSPVCYFFKGSQNYKKIYKQTVEVVNKFTFITAWLDCKAIPWNNKSVEVNEIKRWAGEETFVIGSTRRSGN